MEGQCRFVAGRSARACPSSTHRQVRRSRKLQEYGKLDGELTLDEGDQGSGELALDEDDEGSGELALDEDDEGSGELTLDEGDQGSGALALDEGNEASAAVLKYYCTVPIRPLPCHDCPFCWAFLASAAIPMRRPAPIKER